MRVCHSQLTPNNIILDETYFSLRMVGFCRTVAELRVQEFARIIFVDDINNFSKKVEDQKPLQYRPSYESFEVPKTVSVNRIIIC